MTKEIKKLDTSNLPVSTSADLDKSPDIPQIAETIKKFTRDLRSNSLTEPLPEDSSVEPLRENESPGPWATYYFPSRCVNSLRGLCSVCGYTVLNQDIPKEKIWLSILKQVRQFLENFEDNVVQKQYGKMVRQGVENPIGLTMSPTGSFFAEDEFPARYRLAVLNKILEEAKKSGVSLVFTAEAHARDIAKKIDQGYFASEQGTKEISLLQNLHTQVILGFESLSSFVRNGLYNKDLSLADFEQAAFSLQEKEIGVGAFVFCGLSPMTDLEAKTDAIKTVKYLLDKDIFPVLMFANIQPNTIADVLREFGAYQMLEPFTVVDTIEEVLDLIISQKPESNWLIPDPVGGPPDPDFAIFVNREHTCSSEKTNQYLRQLVSKLNKDRDVDSFKKELAVIRQSEEYRNYQKVLQDQATLIKEKDLLIRTKGMLNALEEQNMIENYLKNKKEV